MHRRKNSLMDRKNYAVAELPISAILQFITRIIIAFGLLYTQNDHDRTSAIQYIHTSLTLGFLCSANYVNATTVEDYPGEE